MGNGESDELRQAREAARREREAAGAAREEAKRIREEAHRLRARARDLERELREEQRKERDREREERRQRIRGRGPGPGFPPPPGRPHGFHTHFNVNFGDLDGAKVEQDFEAEGVRAVQVHQTAGKILVRHCDPGETPGVVTAGNKTPPTLELRRDGARVVIDVKLSTGWLFRRRQGATTVVRVPSGLEELRVDTGAGELDIRGIEASTIRLATGAGEIKTLGTSGSLSADAGAGKITLHAHRGLAKADAGAGDVLMDIAEVAPGEYRGNAGMGRVEMRLPAGHQVHIRATSGIGKSRVEYPSAGEDAPTSIRIESGIGEASVRTRRPGDDDPASSDSPSTSSGAGSKPQRPGRAEASRRRREAEELRVLQLLEQGKITSTEAADLIAALQGMTLSELADEISDGDDDLPANATTA